MFNMYVGSLKFLVIFHNVFQFFICKRLQLTPSLEIIYLYSIFVRKKNSLHFLYLTETWIWPWIFPFLSLFWILCKRCNFQKYWLTFYLIQSSPFSGSCRRGFIRISPSHFRVIRNNSWPGVGPRLVLDELSLIRGEFLSDGSVAYACPLQILPDLPDGWSLLYLFTPQLLL